MTTSEELGRSSELLSAERSCLLVVDVQERLLPVIQDHRSLLQSVRFLLDAAAVLQVPAVVSEQYPKGLGHTVAALQGHVAIAAVFDKLAFSAAAEFGRHWRQSLCLPADVAPDAHTVRSADTSGPMTEAAAGLPQLQGRDQIVICGIEAHICVLQTALDLLSAGQRVFVVADAVGSRRALDYHIALQRLRDAGCTVLTSESVAFEWCQTAGTDLFRGISRLVKDRDAARAAE